MGKELVKVAGIGAIEALLDKVQSKLGSRLDRIESHLDKIESQMDDLRKESLELRRESLELRKEMNERFEKSYELMSELGIRINTVDTRLDTFTEFLRRDSAKMDAWLERLVRVEVSQKLRPRKAG